MSYEFNHKQVRTVTVDLDGEEQDIEVVVVYSIGRAEPDVGIMNDFVDDMYLEDDEGKRYNSVEDAITQHDWAILAQQVMEAHE